MDLLDYNSFDEKTKNFIKRTIDIYFTIKDEKLKFYQTDDLDKGEKMMSVRDKKAYSIFLASGSLDDEIKKVYSEYEEFTLDDFCKYISIDKSDLDKKKELSDDEYKKTYDDEFKTFIGLLINHIQSYNDKVVINPVVIIYALISEGKGAGSKIISSYLKSHTENFIVTALDHPLYSDIRYFCESKGYLVHKDFSKNNNTPSSELTFIRPLASSSPIIPPVFLDFLGGIEDPTKKLDEKTKEKIKEETEKKKKLSDDIWEIIDVLVQKFIGQEELSEDLFYNIVNNIKLAERADMLSGERSIIFIDGPSGTGKTAISEDIAKSLGVPWVCTSITNYSSTGYVGDDLEDILSDLYEKAGHDLEKAQRGIVILDEFDKLAMSPDRDLRMKGAVQDQLLKLLGGGQYRISSGRGLMSSSVSFDTSRLTFICLGAITDLREEKTDSKQRIGFSTADETETKTYSITPQDLIDMGLKKELVGRINTYLHTDDYSKEVLERILRRSIISPLLSFKQWVKSYGKEVVIDEDVYPLIALYAYDLNTGARSLQTIMNGIRTRFIKEVLRGDSKEIHIDAAVVTEIYSKTLNRKARD